MEKDNEILEVKKQFEKKYEALKQVYKMKEERLLKTYKKDAVKEAKITLASEMQQKFKALESKKIENQRKQLHELLKKYEKLLIKHAELLAEYETLREMLM